MIKAILEIAAWVFSVFLFFSFGYMYALVQHIKDKENLREELFDQKDEHNKWIIYYECPKCGEITRNNTECCPFCGAKMSGGE